MSFKNNLLLSEGTYDSYTILSKYFDMIANELLKRHSKKDYVGFTFDVDRMSGTWMWNSENNQVYATLGWEMQDELPIDVDEGDISINSKICKVSKLTFNLKKDISMYFKAILPILNKLK